MGRYRTVTDLASFCRHIRTKGLTLAPADAEDADLPDVVDLVCPKPPPTLTAAMLRAAVQKLTAERVAPHSTTRHPVAFSEDTGEPCMWHEPPPEAAVMGPYYSVNLPPEVLATLQADPEFAAGVAAGEFAVVHEAGRPSYVIIRAGAPVH